jgi:hypothetical protein
MEVTSKKLAAFSDSRTSETVSVTSLCTATAIITSGIINFMEFGHRFAVESNRQQIGQYVSVT